VTHDFRLTDGAPVSPNRDEDEEFYIFGRAGTVSWFGIQTRDRFGNFLNGTGLELSVALIDQHEKYYNWTLITAGEWSGADSEGGSRQNGMTVWRASDVDGSAGDRVGGHLTRCL
jgi:hypothetical protein